MGEPLAPSVAKSRARDDTARSSTVPPPCACAIRRRALAALRHMRRAPLNAVVLRGRSAHHDAAIAEVLLRLAERLRLLVRAATPRRALARGGGHSEQSGASACKANAASAAVLHLEGANLLPKLLRPAVHFVPQACAWSASPLDQGRHPLHLPTVKPFGCRRPISSEARALTWRRSSRCWPCCRLGWALGHLHGVIVTTSLLAA